MLKCMILDRDIPALNAFVEYLEQMNAALADVRQLVKRNSNLCAGGKQDYPLKRRRDSFHRRFWRLCQSLSFER